MLDFTNDAESHLKGNLQFIAPPTPPIQRYTQKEVKEKEKVNKQQQQQQ